MSARSRAPIPVANSEWIDRAECRTADAELFFPPDGERKPEKEMRERAAKSVCGRCPVARQCLVSALDRREMGVWGGTSDEDRVQIRRRRKRAA